MQGATPGFSRATMLVAAFLSTLIKSPVFLPACVAVVWHRARTAGLRRFVRSDAAALVVAAALGVAAFRLYWMAANGTWALITPWEERQYFGPVAERLGASAWRPVLRNLVLFTSRPVALALAGFGLLHAGRRRRSGLAPLFTYVLYLFGGTQDDWNPARLYFARRDGRNVPLRDAVPDRLEAFRVAAEHKGYPRVVAFTFGEAGARALLSARVVLLATAGCRRLFLLRPLAP